MPTNLLKEQVPLGKIAYQWVVKEYERHKRERRWYVTMGILSAAMLIYAVVAGNSLFALIIVLFGIILFLHEMQPPMEVSFAITETGIIIGSKHYRYNELINFWIVYNPPLVKNLYFSSRNFFKHRLQVPLLDYDPRPIRDYLNQFLTEDLEQEEEPLSDRLGRILKLH